MADQRDIGMRVGAATNQAVSITTHFLNELGPNPRAIAAFVEQQASELLAVMNRLQAQESGSPQPAARPAPLLPTQAPTTQGVADAFGATVEDEPGVNPKYGYDTNFSGSRRPIRLADDSSLPQWLYTQARAVGVTEVWDNRGNDKYVAAIRAGADKTPPPFRSATEGVDKSFWPPKG